MAGGEIKQLFTKWYARSGQISPVRRPRLTRRRLMQVLGEYGFQKGAEIGVDRGQFSERMMTDIPGLHLLAVDIWHWRFRGPSCYLSTLERLVRFNDGPVPVFNMCHRCGRIIELTDATMYMTTPQCVECQPDAAYEGYIYSHPVTARSAVRLAEGRAIMLRMESMEAVRLVEDESLDFVYIDGDHRFDAVMSDLIWWARKVRPGGVVAGHDYYRFRHAGVVPAVNAYTQQHRIQQWFLTDEKCATFFWVREPSFVEAPYRR